MTPRLVIANFNPNTERQLMQTNSHNVGITDASLSSEGLKGNQFRLVDVPSGSALLVGDAAVFSVAGSFCATQAKCPHKQGPLNEGPLDGSTVTCPWHGSQFNVCTGEVLKGPAVDPLTTYRVIAEGEIGRVEA